MVHTTGGSERTDGGRRPRARSVGVGVGRDSRYGSIYVCPPSPPPRPRAAVLPPLLLLPPPQSPGSHTLNSSHWALARDAGSAGCIERRSPDWAACSAMCWRRAGGGPASTLRVTVTPGWAFSLCSVSGCGRAPHTLSCFTQCHCRPCKLAYVLQSHRLPRSSGRCEPWEAQVTASL